MVFKNHVNVFSLFCFYLPLEKGGHLFEQMSIPFTQEVFLKSLAEIGLVVPEKMFKFPQTLSFFANLLYIPLGYGVAFH